MSSNWLERPTGYSPSLKPGNQVTGLTKWTAEGKAMARIDQSARIEAHRDLTNTRSELLRGELRKQETLQMLRNTDEVIDEAMRLANHNEAKMEVFGQMVMGYAKTEGMIYGANHNPFLKGEI